MVIVTQGLGSCQSGVMVCQGYGDMPCIPPPPPAPAQPAVAPRGIMGGGNHYDIDVPIDEASRIINEEPDVLELQPVFDGEKIDFRPKMKEERLEEKVIDLDPLRMQELLREGQELDARLTGKMRRLEEKERGMAEMEARILAELAQLEEQNAMAMERKKGEMETVSLFHGGVQLPLRLLDQAQFLPEEPHMKPPSFYDDILVPLSIGFLLGASLTMVSLTLYKFLKRNSGIVVNDGAEKK